MGRVNDRSRQRVMSDCGAALLNSRAETLQRIGEDFFNVCLAQRLSGESPGFRVFQQPIHQLLHPVGALDDEIQMVPIFLSQCRSITLKELREDLDRAQRFPQVVRGSICKLLQILIGASQGIARTFLLTLNFPGLGYVAEDENDTNGSSILVPDRSGTIVNRNRSSIFRSQLSVVSQADDLSFS